MVPFLFATSLIRITATGLDEDAVIDNVKVSGLNTVCKLTVSGDGTPSIEGANLGTITKTAGIDKTNDKGQVLFKVAVPASDASSSDRSVEFTIGGKTCTAAFSGAAIESGKAYSAMAENNAIEGIALNKTSTTIPSGSTETLTATVYPLKSIQAVNWESSNTAVASVDVNGIVTGVAFGTATITATSQDNSSIKAACTVTVDLAYVTIGEKKWATTNLGATTIAGSLATCAGDYYQWGSVDKLYNSITWTDNTTGSFVELETDGFADANLTYKGNANLSDKTNDVVKKTYPGTNWRMPTSQEFKDLYNACGGIYDEGKYVTESCGESTNVDKGVYRCGNYDGVAGFLFVAEDNGPHLFFPAAGYVNGTSLIDAVSVGCYWSSTLYSDSTDKAHFLYFDSSSVNPQDCLSRYVGFSVRPVSD